MRAINLATGSIVMSEDEFIIGQWRKYPERYRIIEEARESAPPAVATTHSAPAESPQGVAGSEGKPVPARVTRGRRRAQG